VTSRIALSALLAAVAVATCTATATRASAAGPGQPGQLPSQMVAVTYAPTAPANGATLEAAARLMKGRAYVISPWVNATVTGQHIVVTGPAADAAALRSLAFPAAVVRFRAVLLYAAARGKAHGDTSLVNPGVRALFDRLTCRSPASHDQSNPNTQVVSCDSGGGKYALATATVLGEEIAGASAASSTTDDQWQVNFGLNRTGAAAFAALTTRLYNRYYAGSSSNSNDAVLDQVAIVVNGSVVSSDSIDQPLTNGQVQISGSTITQAYAQKLAEDLQPALPVGLRVVTVRTYTLTGTSTTVSY
jgi:preprotein translocase subunit SecD